jgi:hypothetical protein
MKDKLNSLLLFSIGITLGRLIRTVLASKRSDDPVVASGKLIAGESRPVGSPPAADSPPLTAHQSCPFRTLPTAR